MRRRAATCAGAAATLVAAAAAVATALAATPPPPPPDAPAHASVRTALPCYLPEQTVRISGSGFSPSATYSVILDRVALGPGTVAPDGTIAGSLSSGKLAPGTHERRHRLQVTDGANIGRVGFSTTAFDALFTPSAGNPRTLRVSFAVYGIGLGHNGPTAVYLHYLDPRGHLLATTQLGHTLGACGNLAGAPPRALFPFHTVAQGKWMLQFDTRRSYAATNSPRIVRAVAVGR